MYACEEYIDLISGGADSELNEPDAARLREHLDSCEGCKALYEFYISMDGALASMEEEPPARLAEGVMFSIRNEKKRGGLRGRFAFRSFTAVAAAIALVILITSYKDSFIVNNSAPLSGGGAPPPAAPPQAAMSAAAPEIAMFGADTGETESGMDESDAGDNAVRFEVAETPATRTMPTSAPAGNEDALLFSAAPAATAEPQAEAPAGDNMYASVVDDILAAYNGRLSKALLFYEAPLGIDEKSASELSGTVYYIVTDSEFAEIEAMNTRKGVGFTIVDNNVNLNAAASNFVIIVLG